MKYIKSFPKIIPQPYGVYDNWNYFIHKACSGSYKADEIFTHAEYALMEFRTGIEEPRTKKEAEDFNIILQNQFHDTPPFKNEGDLFSQLLSACEIKKKPKIKKKQYYKREQYQNLWKEGYVETYNLLHDSVLRAFENWGYSTYQNIQDVLLNETLEYNSLDIVTGLIMLITSFIDDCPEAFKKESYSI